MRAETAQRLVALNREFYQNGAVSFSATRQRIQPGMRRILSTLPDEGSWLDIGCGNGNFARSWLAIGKRGKFTGIDFSVRLLMDARNTALVAQPQRQTQVNFFQADISLPGWQQPFENTGWDGAFLFAVLHHLPCEALRVRFLREIFGILKPGGWIFLSVWQPQNSARLWARRQLWEAIGLTPGDVEEGDVLLDWRAEKSSNCETAALRYVHVFQAEELRALADSCGFKVSDEFLSDGNQNNLALYQVWKRS